MEKKRSGLLRPVAWIVTAVLICCMEWVSKLVCKLGSWAVNEFSHLSTGMIILLVLLFGSIYVGLYIYSAVILPQLLVSVSDAIYPSNHAFRYYFSGTIDIILCIVFIVGGILGWIIQTGNTSMFWFYASRVHFAIAMIIMMRHDHSSAEERHKAVTEPAP